MPAETTKFVVVYETGNRLHFDWVCSALNDASVPYFVQERNTGGLRTALPVLPTAMPGVSWAVFVPEANAAEASRVIGELPFDRSDEPGIWNFSSYPEIRRIAKVVILAWLLILLAGFVYRVINEIK